jgi:ERF superfamily
VSTPLRQRAAERTDRPAGPPARRPVPSTVPATPAVPAVAPSYDDNPIPEPPAQVPVHVAWWRVMCDVRDIPKTGEFRDQDRGPVKWTFRPVDHVVAAASNSVRRHGVFLAPVKTVLDYSEKTSRSGTRMRECTATVTWRVFGPMGDHFDVEVAGEALDTSDKATTKAQTVSYRQALIYLLLVPTGQRDPDEDHYERGVGGPTPLEYADEMLDPTVTAGRLQTIRTELKTDERHRVVVDVPGLGAMSLGQLWDHVNTARREGRPALPPEVAAPAPSFPTDEPAPTEPAEG